MFNKIIEWAQDRNLIEGSDPKSQMLKLVEEMGELSNAIAKNDIPLCIDAIGDCAVVLTIISKQLGLEFESCVASAYDEIKDRKGKMINGVFVKQKEEEILTKFMLSCKNGNLKKVKELIKNGADVNLHDIEGFAALHWAAYNGHLNIVKYLDVVKYLVKNGAEVNLQDKYGWTALHRAAWSGNSKIVKYLVKNGADLNLKNYKGNTALDIAVRKSHNDIGDYLKSKGAKQ